jgi:hypothetical protein
MNRLNFLKLAAVSSLAVIASQWNRKLPFPIPGDIFPGDFICGPGGKLFHGTADGRILASADGGRTWRRNTNFGEDCRVRGLSIAGGNLLADIGITGGTFQLASADGVVWRTVG